MFNIRVLRGLANVTTALLVAVAAAVGGASSAPRAAIAIPPPPPTPPFTQCPPVGYDTGCAVLIILGPGGTKTTLTDPAQGPFDGVEDTLIGIQNNSGSTVSSFTLTGAPPPGNPPVFQFDGDGLCSGVSSTGAPGFITPPVGCPYGTTRYEGRANATAVASSAATTFPAESFTAISVDENTGTVNFLNPSIPDGGSAYFSLEGPTASIAPCVAGVPASVSLSPFPTATNTVSTNHTVTATVTDVCGVPSSGVTVQFTVARDNGQTITGNCTTNASGVCSFTYAGPILPAVDAITGCAGPSGLPPCGATSKVWVLPVGVSSCVVDITGGGWMIANNGDKVSFGGTVHTDQAGAPSGQEQYTDSPANLNVHSINILAVTCTKNQEKADIYGTATENGTGSHLFRIEVTDPDSTGGSDTYQITLDNYESGSHSLGGGHIEMHTT
jgi:hypothetical protein